ncbi:MAG: CPBP family intramembrane metalloprotease [Acidobacteriia bacterium]|nr:CPBP family intramembrane metalloprotease [Terriglobia bacterium]
MDDSLESPPPPDQDSEPLRPPPASPVEAYPPPSFADHMYTVFVGPGGLRVGWRFLLYLCIGFATFSILGGLANQLHGIGSLREMFVDKAVFVLAVMLPAVAMARIERCRFGAYGLPRHGLLGRNFWIGTLWGLGGITLLLLILYFAHAFDFGYPVLQGQRIVKFAVFWGAFFMLVALSEEFLFRGYTLFTLTQGIGFWPSAVVLSIAFGAIHLQNNGEAWIGVVAAGAIGFFFCLTLRRTGDLWFALGFHAAWDWGETYLYSVPDSGMVSPGHLLHSSFHGPTWLTGGDVGPEGSVLLFVVMAVLWITFDRLYPEVKYKG